MQFTSFVPLSRSVASAQELGGGLLIVPLCGDDEAPNKSVHFFPVGSEACVIARIEAYEFPLTPKIPPHIQLDKECVQQKDRDDGPLLADISTPIFPSSLLSQILLDESYDSYPGNTTFARYTERTSFERPLTSGVAYAVRVLNTERDQFEVQQRCKRMDKVEKNPVHEDEYDPADLEPSPVQDEYAPVIFAPEIVAHVISVDVLSGKEDRENVLRARESRKGVLTAPFRLLKTNRLGVILIFAVYKGDISADATPAERIQETA
ncbi:Hexokinase-3 [Orobanche gracilis]